MQQVVQAIASGNPQLLDPLHPQLTYCAAEVIWAVRSEMACTVEDILARRTRALFLNAQAAIDLAPKIAAIMAEELGQDEMWIANQLEAFRAIAANYLVR